jgi:hypothetical protein
LEFAGDNVGRALQLGGEALEILTRGKDARSLVWAYGQISACCVARGEMEKAREAALQSLHYALEIHADVLDIAIALQFLALLAALQQKVPEAARLISYVNMQFKERGIERGFVGQWVYDRIMAALHEQLSDVEIDGLALESAAWSEDRAVTEALKV